MMQLATAGLRTFTHCAFRSMPRYACAMGGRVFVKRSIAHGRNSVIDTKPLFDSISELNKLNIRPRNFPALVVTGPQSSGKTSVIECIIGILNLFPKGMGMTTMKPFLITTIASDILQISVCDKNYGNVKDAHDEIDRVNRNEHFKTIPVTIRSPNVQNMFLIDLPGLNESSNKELRTEINDINKEYIRDLNNIPVIILAAPYDPETNRALRYVFDLNKNSEAFGIVTKMDLEQSTVIKKLFEGKLYVLKYGYQGVILPNENDLKSGKTMQDKEKEEEEFKAKNPHFSPFGSKEMKKTLEYILYEKFKGNIPALLADIKQEKFNSAETSSQLDTLVNNKNNQLSVRLREIIHKIVKTSVPRARFERGLKQSFEAAILPHLEKALPKIKDEDKAAVYAVKTSPIVADKNIVEFLKKVKAKPHKFKTDKFKELFSAGLLSATHNEKQIKKAEKHDNMLAAATILFDFVEDDPSGEKRDDFNIIAERFVESVLENDFIQNAVQRITLSDLTKFLQKSKDHELDNVGKVFVEYLINEIGDETFKSEIRYSIYATINKEKRPTINKKEISRQLTQIYEKEFTFYGTFWEKFNHTNHKIQIVMYDPPFVEAYLRAASAKIIDDIFSTVTTCYLDKLIDKVLEKTIELCKQNNLENRQSEMKKKIDTLNNLEKVVMEYYEPSAKVSKKEED